MDAFSLRSPFLASPLPLNTRSSFHVRRTFPLPLPLPIRRILTVHSSKPNPTPQTLTPISNLVGLAKTPLSILIFSLSLSFLPFPTKLPPIAIAVTTTTLPKSKNRKGSRSTLKEHDFSSYTKTLLASVKVLLDQIEDVKKNAGAGMAAVNEALKSVRQARKEIEEEVLEKLNSELKELRKVKVELVERAEEVIKKVTAVTRERDGALKKGGGEEGWEREIGELEKEYNELWEKIGKIEDAMLRKQTLVLSVAVRELAFIERESELLVQRFERQLRMKGSERYCFELYCRQHF